MSRICAKSRSFLIRVIAFNSPPGPDDQSFLLILEDGIWRSYVEAGCGSLHKIRDKICAAVNSLREQDSDKSPPKISGVHELLASAAKSKE